MSTLNVIKLSAVIETTARLLQRAIRSRSRSRGLDTVFRCAPDLLGRRSLP
jgi:hypothetical protein